ncbi:hypothetical protein B296_00027438 [Ensete ventricosum]|uniref:Uncharacterized protein n=1 Tax=Ensete ventricosum TaxID=4639 RepID=A0A427A5R1_ENSVE|nr:hypothetical protein B296_00027438 [Ensete ventricosum]
MNRVGKSAVWVGTSARPPFSSPLTFFKPRARVASYKASRGFESGLENMGRVNYEFGYQVALATSREAPGYYDRVGPLH